MKDNLLSDLSTHKAANTIFVEKEFADGLPLVWDAFTSQEILDQWSAPKPWKAQTISMDLRTGGRRFFKIVSPEGQEHFSVQDYVSIASKTSLSYISGFSDRNENINPEFYGTENKLDFCEANGITTVRMSVKYQSPAIFEMMAERNHGQGLMMTWDNLETLLATL